MKFRIIETIKTCTGKSNTEWKFEETKNILFNLEIFDESIEARAIRRIQLLIPTRKFCIWEEYSYRLECQKANEDWESVANL